MNEFVTRTDGVLGAGILAGANPKNAKEMRKLGAEFFYEQQKWAWETLIWHLCNEDLTKFHAVCDLPLILVFNFLGMRKELNV